MKVLPTCVLLAGLFLPLAAGAAPSGNAPLPASISVKRDVPPEIPSEIPKVNLPVYADKTLDNGIPVYFLTSHRVPLAHIIVSFRNGGSKDDPVGKYGLANLAMDLTDEGVGDMDSLEYSKAMDILGADITAVASWDSSGFTASFMTKNSKPVAELLRDLILHPTFPQKELDRLKKSTIDGFVEARSQPETIAAVAFNRLIFGPDSRYGTLRVGTPAQVASITRDDILNYYKRVVRPENAFICIGGDAEPEMVIAEMNQHLGKWKIDEPAPQAIIGPREAAPQVTTRYIPADTPAEEIAKIPNQIYIVDRPGSHQTVVRAGCLGISAKDPDEIIVKTMNTILGGSFTSRLNMNLREKNGFTYGASSGFDRRMDRGAFVAATSVQTDRTNAAVWEIGQEIRGMSQPVSDEELTRAKNYLARTFPTFFETGASMVTHMCRVVTYDLGHGYAKNYIPTIMAITPADIQRVAKRTLDIKEMKIVLVGDAAKISEQLKRDKMWAQVLTVDEVMGPKVTAKELLFPTAMGVKASDDK